MSSRNYSRQRSFPLKRRFLSLSLSLSLAAESPGNISAIIIIHISQDTPPSPSRSRPCSYPPSLPVILPYQKPPSWGKTLIRGVEAKLCRISAQRGAARRSTNDRVTVCISRYRKYIHTYINRYVYRGFRGSRKGRTSRGGLRPRNISWSPVDLHRCGRPDTPNSLSRSNLIGRPQRLSTADLV